MEEVTDWNVEKELDPDSLVVNGEMLTGEKLVELDLPDPEREFKGRMVAGGHNVRDTQNVKVKEKGYISCKKLLT